MQENGTDVLLPLWKVIKSASDDPSLAVSDCDRERVAHEEGYYNTNFFMPSQPG